MSVMLKDIFHILKEFAITLKWPESVWTLLLQCVLTSKAQEAYSSLTLEQRSDYKIIKTAILRTYKACTGGVYAVFPKLP